MTSPTTLLKPALTERQQLALLLQMTDPHNQQGPQQQGTYTMCYASCTCTLYMYLVCSFYSTQYPLCYDASVFSLCVHSLSNRKFFC